MSRPTFPSRRVLGMEKRSATGDRYRPADKGRQVRGALPLRWHANLAVRWRGAASKVMPGTVMGARTRPPHSPKLLNQLLQNRFRDGFGTASAAIPKLTWARIASGRCGVAEDRTALLKQRAQQANDKYALLREGFEPEISDDVLGVVRWQARPQRKDSQQTATDKRIPFNVPMTRAHRLTTIEGVTSFHFAHSFINKVSSERMEDGRRNRPGAARAHNKYVERETAVATLADIVDPAIAASPSTEPANAADHEENEHDHEEEDGVVAGPAGGRSEGTDAARPFLQRHLEILGDFPPGDDAEPGADLRLLSGFELVRHGGHPELLVQGAAPVSVDTGPVAAAVRQPRSRPGRHAGTQAAITAQTPSGHDRYLVRGGAVAIQPDGDRVLFTNIDADPDKRAEFWTLVEEHERSAGSDQMSCRFADRPDFWAAVARRHDCPPALRDQYATADHDKIVRFDIDSGKAMRKFLGQQAGWDAEKGDDQTFARFHDGRAGRTQYRIVGELPDELPMARKMQLLRDFTEEFRRRRIPFVAVMHAPDHNNDEKNWHFHLVYYDRPCARITAAQIAELERNGHDTGRLAPGMWDFAAATVKRDRVNRELWPLRQKKVEQVGNDRWIMALRRSFARMTNVQLEQAGVARRVDPRRHADMGIVADPQEHLGTRQAAAEARGTVTAAGTRNEERQSQAILTQLDQAHAHALTDAVRRVADLKRRLADRPTIDGADPLAEVERNLVAAADLERLAAGLRHADDRAVSRATNLKRMNGQLVRAIDADASAGSRRERQSRAGIVAGADRYLHILDIALRDDRRLIADCTEEAARRREAVRLVEARLEELANAPAGPKLVTEPTAPPPQPIVDPVEQWLRQIEQRRPLILLDGKSFVLAGIKPPIGIDTAPVQARLGKLYRRQQDDIAHIVRELHARRLSLGIRTVDGRGRRYLEGIAPALASAFSRYQDSSEIKAAIEAIIRPDVAARSAPAFAPPPVTRKPITVANTVAAPISLQRAAIERETPQIAAAPAIAAVVTPPPSDMSPAAPISPAAKMPDRAPAPSTSSPKSPPPDPAIVARDLVARNVPLTFDEDDRIDRAALLAAKVDAGIVGALQNNAYLAGRVGMQVEQALAQVQKHARSKPLNLIRRGEQLTLGGDAPAELIELSRFHARAPRMQDRLRQLHDELNAHAEMQSAPAAVPVETRSPKAAQAPSQLCKSPSSADILQGEAARQAALRAAQQRGR